MLNTEYHLTSIDSEQNRNRFYSISVQPGLFGNFYLTCCWGRIGTKGRKLTKYFETEERITQEVKRLLRVRERHGYIDKPVGFF